MNAIETLAANIAKLSEKDQDFARSLVDQAQRRGLSDKQMFWVNKLAQRATTGEPERVKVAVGDCSGIMALFARAQQHLKRAAIVIGIDGSEYRLTVAGPTARVPGSVNVTDVPERDADFGMEAPERVWFGRILQSGVFEASPRAETPKALGPGLARFAADPAGVAAEHGRLTGKCCFCNKALTDQRSTSVGYGGTCAKHYGLPWGNAETVRQQFAAVAA